MKHFFILLFSALIFNNANAAPGDTTWVQAQVVQQLGATPKNFDTTVNFPSGATKYRKIIMVFTLGKYSCPPGSTYCADWDYTVTNYAMNAAGDTVEIGRLITPYANSARLTAGWKHEYYFDVTDFSTVLKNANTIRINYSGYSGGFTGDIKFALIEGTPDRDALGVGKLWNGYFAYGNAATPIDTKVSAKSVTAPAGTVTANFRLQISGHGSDPNYCSEFCSKYYDVLKNGTAFAHKDIWRNNCGSNEIYPQNGTWIYDRGNWCPGAAVQTLYHTIPSVSGGNTFDIAMNFEPYTSTGAAGYGINGSVIFYGPINKSIDASIEEIIAPSNYGGSFRENDRIGFTTIKLHNSGSTPISSVDFEYGVTGQPLTKETWFGTLAPLADTIIDLPVAYSLLAATGTNVGYEVNIIKVNGSTDEDATNNKFTSVFTPAPVWPSDFVVIFRTNKATSGGFAETEWKIKNINSGVTKFERINNAISTTYYDTVNLPTGIYTLTVSDAGCDGLAWWANTASVGSGSIQVKPTAFSTLATKGNFGGDFGCGFTQYFRVGAPTAIKNINQNMGDATMDIFPNPAQNEISISIDGFKVSGGQLVVTDNIGRTISTQSISQNTAKINTVNFANGLYFVRYLSDKTDAPKLVSKLVILK